MGSPESAWRHFVCAALSATPLDTLLERETSGNTITLLPGTLMFELRDAGDGGEINTEMRDVEGGASDGATGGCAMRIYLRGHLRVKGSLGTLHGPRMAVACLILQRGAAAPPARLVPQECSCSCRAAFASLPWSDPSHCCAHIAALLAAVTQPHAQWMVAGPSPRAVVHGGDGSSSGSSANGGSSARSTSSSFNPAAVDPRVDDALLAGLLAGDGYSYTAAATAAAAATSTAACPIHGRRRSSSSSSTPQLQPPQPWLHAINATAAAAASKHALQQRYANADEEDAIEDTSQSQLDGVSGGHGGSGGQGVLHTSSLAQPFSTRAALQLDRLQSTGRGGRGGRGRGRGGGATAGTAASAAASAGGGGGTTGGRGSARAPRLILNRSRS